MQLYTTKDKKSMDVISLERILPKKLLMSKEKKSGYFENYRRYAPKYEFIRFNSEERIDSIIIDVDDSCDAGEWLDHDVPQPTWIIKTTRGYQCGWVLKKPIFVSEKNKNKNRDEKYLMDILKKLVFTFAADTNAIGFSRVFRNPTYIKASAICRFDLEYDLRDFKHLSSPPHLFKNEKEEESIGRNSSLFDKVRKDAYLMMKQGRYSSHSIEARAISYNYDFDEPLCEKEVAQITKSIDKFMIERYSGENFYMQNTTPEQRKEIAAKNGKKGGAVTAKVRSSEARARIYAAITQMKSFEIKITISEVARRAKSSRDTVRAYLEMNPFLKS